jgi:hypothetical protein
MIRENSLKQYRVLAHSHVARTLLVFIALMLGAFSAQAMTATITPATGGGAIPSNSDRPFGGGNSERRFSVGHDHS